MKYTLLQLKKTKLPLTVDETFDFKEELNGFEDILDSGIANVKETLEQHGDIYLVKAHINISLTLESCISLKKVPYVVDTDAQFEYISSAEQSENSDAIVIENGTIDTREAILTEILCNKPMTVYLDGEEFEDDIEEDDDDKINPAFSSLADLLK